MKVRPISEVRSLDDELNLFDESSWDFMGVDSSSENFEYFNDIRDTDFDKEKLSVLKEWALPIISVLLVFCSSVLIMLNVTGVLDFDEYNKVASINNVGDRVESQTYTTGAEGTSSDIVACSGVLDSYFRCLKEKNGYDTLDELCKLGSVFAKKYYSSTDKIKVLYDTSDCYARALREFGSLCEVDKINKIVYKDDVYYVYIDLKYPSSDDIYEYIHQYAYNLTKYFTRNKVTKANMIRFLLETTEAYPISCSTTECCLKMERVNNSYVLKDDTYIARVCEQAYKDAITQMSNTLGNKVLEK